jgi:hypothetical protein
MMARLLVTIPLAYACLYAVRLPFLLMGGIADTWWGSMLAAMGMLPGVGLLWLVHMFQQYGLKLFSKWRDQEDEARGPFGPLLGFLAVIYFYYLIRGPVIAVGLGHPYDGVARAVAPIVRWLLPPPEWLSTFA